MLKNVKISIIVPVYNVELYIKRSVDSILNQTLKEFELFLVDDGSTDNTPKICDDYQKNDDRVIVIHQKNAGAHAARNAALLKACGEYVCFFDSDDYIDESMLLENYEIAKNSEADVVVSGFYIHTYYNENEYMTTEFVPHLNDNNLPYESIKSKTKFRMEVYKNIDRNMFYPPWNKMYKLKYLRDNNLKFPSTYRDDFPFVVSTIRDIENVTYVKKMYYHFIRKRVDSETQKYVPKLYEKREEEHKMLCDLYKYWGLENDKNSNEMISRRYIDRVIECMVNLFNKECALNNTEKVDLIKSYLDNNNLQFALKYAKPKKLYSKIMYTPIKLRNATLCFEMANFINNVKTKNIKLFSTLKANR